MEEFKPINPPITANRADFFTLEKGFEGTGEQNTLAITTLTRNLNRRDNQK
jgi:hypothetical protein